MNEQGEILHLTDSEARKQSELLRLTSQAAAILGGMPANDRKDFYAENHNLYVGESGGAGMKAVRKFLKNRGQKI